MSVEDAAAELAAGVAAPAALAAAAEPAADAALDADPYNTLVISDLHLGEDLSPAATEATRVHVSIVERQLLQFLRHYTRRREDGRPWRLVINGDLIDFLSIAIRPDHPEFSLLAVRPTQDEREHGLHRTPRTAIAAIEAVAERHAEVFRALARFAARGNRIEIVCGNHDAELTFPEAQAALRACLARAWNALPEAGRLGAPSGAEVVRAVGFHPWFFYRKGSLWIEHGHQFDENCSFEHQLDPCRPGTDVIAMNVDVASTRYIANRVQEADSYSHESWSMLGYLRFGAGLGLRGCLELARAYLRFGGAMLAGWRQNRATRAAREEQRARHLARLREIAREAGVAEETLTALDALHRPPVVGHLRRLTAVMMIDRIVLYAIGIAGALASLALVPGSLGAALAVTALALAAITARLSGRERAVDNVSALDQASELVLGQVDARFVVFGHTHEPVARPAGDGERMYFNTGTWVPGGRPGLLRSFTHLVVRQREAGPVAELCQWRDGLSRAFTPGWLPATQIAGAPARAALEEAAGRPALGEPARAALEAAGAASTAPSAGTGAALGARAARAR
ncbi:MAG TPA: hypothetical protein VKZ63_01645 [Kofleriaceae bacterium]|nr:hypothetical protein [Kofleriaceae bacterium]